MAEILVLVYVVHYFTHTQFIVEMFDNEMDILSNKLMSIVEMSGII